MLGRQSFNGAVIPHSGKFVTTKRVETLGEQPISFVTQNHGHQSECEPYLGPFVASACSHPQIDAKHGYIVLIIIPLVHDGRFCDKYACQHAFGKLSKA